MALLGHLTILLLALRAALACAGQPTNVLVIIADDLRPDCLTLTGARRPSLPNIEALAARACVFSEASLEGSTYPAVCVASRAMLLTGQGTASLPRNPAAIRVSSSPSTLPRLFRDVRYATFHTGKNESRPEDLYRDFETSQSLPRGVDTEARHARDAATFIRGHAERPWLACVEFALPHDPQDAPDEYLRRFTTADIESPTDFRPEHPFDNGELRVRDELTLPRPLTLESVMAKRARYMASAAWLDRQVGVLLETLRATGQEGRTFVVFLSDNGLSLGDHGLLGKQNLYAFGGMHVPLLIAGPSVRPRVTPALAQVHDLLPTLAELAGINDVAARPAAGRSLAPVLRGDSEQVRPLAFSRYRDVQFSAFDGRWKLIVYPKVGVAQLFDRRADPRELRDLSAAAEAAPERLRLEAELRRWRDTLR